MTIFNLTSFDGKFSRLEFNLDSIGWIFGFTANIRSASQWYFKRKGERRGQQSFLIHILRKWLFI
ncbi:MAG: hypothetical protein VKN72_26440 [Nostocales cyanobacterium 94392]|nr:hypothetical protein [Nostocales cyanobacterium 94392]